MCVRSVGLLLQVCGVVGGPVSLGVVRRVLLAGWTRLRERCIAGCSSGSAGVDCDVNPTGTYNDRLDQAQEALYSRLQQP